MYRLLAENRTTGVLSKSKKRRSMRSYPVLDPFFDGIEPRRRGDIPNASALLSRPVLATTADESVVFYSCREICGYVTRNGRVHRTRHHGRPDGDKSRRCGLRRGGSQPLSRTRRGT